MRIEEHLKRILTQSRLGRIVMILPRSVIALRSVIKNSRFFYSVKWVFTSKEFNNWTYRTTPENKAVLCAMISVISDKKFSDVMGYLQEIESDDTIKDFVLDALSKKELRWQTDPEFKPGRRLAYYLLARCLKPAVVVEAGLDKGYGASIINRALQINRSEGAFGSYKGIEFDPQKKLPLFSRDFHSDASVIYDDSVEVISKLDGEVDLFVHDTISDDSHMIPQLSAMKQKLSSAGVIISVWTTRSLIEFAEKEDMILLTHKDETIEHPDAGARISLLKKRVG